MSRKYATGTKVPVSRTKAAIEKLLIDHGASAVASGWDNRAEMETLMFQLANRTIRFRVRLPIDDQAEHRRRWRALLLIIKAKLELISSGDSTVDREFMADLVLPDGRNFVEWVQPQIHQAFGDASLPPLLMEQ